MDLVTLAFCLLATVLIGSASLVVTARSPVHAVLFLILSFFSAAGLFVLLGAEFLAMLLVVVYVGAVAVLFLFVVMMLDVDFGSLRSGFSRYLPVGLFVSAVLLVEMILISGAVAHSGATALPKAQPQIAANTIATIVVKTPAKAPLPALPISNTEQIGHVLYTDYIYLFQVAGLILLVAMIGAIVLTLRHKPGVRRQVIADQTARDVKSGLRIVKVKTGEGVLP